MFFFQVIYNVPFQMIYHSLSREILIKLRNMFWSFNISQKWQMFPLRGRINPLSPKSDQHQISPCIINAL